jgi:hypothetical protein
MQSEQAPKKGTPTSAQPTDTKAKGGDAMQNSPLSAVRDMGGAMKDVAREGLVGPRVNDLAYHSKDMEEKK